jgi:hypothetical protein
MQNFKVFAVPDRIHPAQCQFFEKLFFAITIISLFALVSCHEKEKTAPVSQIKVDEIPNKDVKMQEITSAFTIIPLETTDQSLIQYLKKVVLCDDKFFVLDDQRPLFAIFSKTGKFIKSVSKQGKGPGEYYVPTDFIIDSEQGQIELLDGFNRQILIYDLEGNYKNRIRLSIQGNYFVKFQNGDYVIYTNMRNEKEMPYKLVRINNDGRILSRELAYTAKTIQTTSTPFVKTGNDSYLFSEHGCDTIYQVTKEQINPLCYFDLGKYEVPFKYKSDIVLLNQYAHQYAIKSGSPMSLLNNEVIIGYDINENRRYLVYDLQNKTAEYYKISNTFDFAFGAPDYSSEKQLIGVIHPLSLNLHKRSPRYQLAYKVGDKIPEIEALRSNYNELDNPYLVVWDLNFSNQ